MKTLTKYLKLLGMFIKMGWKSQVSYMGISALFSYIAQIIQFASLFGVVWITMRSFGVLGDFNMWQVFILFSLELFTYAVANSFLQPFWKIKELVLNGELDFYLIRPINPFYYIVSKGFVPGYTSHMIISSIITIVSSIQLGLFTSLSFWAIIFVTILIATGIQFGLRCIPALLTFWFGNIDNLQWIVAGSFRRMVQYPLKIYPIAIQAFFIAVLLYAFVNYFPSLLLFGKIGINKGILFTSIGLFVSFFMVFVTIVLFNKGLKRYESGNG